MKKEDIEKRIEEIQPIITKLYHEEYELKEKLKEFSTEKFEEFIKGKKFKADITYDFKRIYLVNSQFSISQMAEHGADDYHQSFYLDKDVSVSVDDGNINISSSKFGKLFKFVDKYNLELDLSAIINQRDNLADILDVLNKAIKKGE